MNNCVLVSGGVDSAVSAALLSTSNNKPTAVYLKIWLEDELSFLGQCPWKEDLEYVQTLCSKLGLALEVVNLQRQYHEQIVSYTLESVKNGLTPNPDVLCNFKIKFGAFLDGYGKNFDTVSTGHYARQEIFNNQAHLLTSADNFKDQTYFLAMLDQSQLLKARFPIGHLTKPEVRALAQEFDLPQKDRKDSQGLCFLGKISFPEFLKFHLGTRPGKLVEFETGKVMGQHEGHYFFTVGQRQGIRLSGGPWYVVCKDHIENTVFISNQYFQDKSRKEVFFDNFKTVVPGTTLPEKVVVKLRHGREFCKAQVTFFTQETGKILLENNDQGIAAGQFVVFYDSEQTECLAIAQISRAK